MGCGRDKVEQVSKTFLAGFKFVVWKKMFVINLTLPGEKKIYEIWPPLTPQIEIFFFSMIYSFKVWV